jgi:hypothetical protein
MTRASHVGANALGLIELVILSGGGKAVAVLLAAPDADRLILALQEAVRDAATLPTEDEP